MESFDEPIEEPSSAMKPGADGAPAPTARSNAPPQIIEPTAKSGCEVPGCEARLGLAVLGEIVDLLPVSITLQDEKGRFLFANQTATAQLSLAVHPPAEAQPDFAQETAEMARRRERGIALSTEVLPVITEERQVDGSLEHIFLTTRQPVEIRGQKLLLSTSFDITERKRIEEELLQRAYFDELTKLPNRCLFEEQVARILAIPDAHFALAFLDLDNFKHINDYYSHAVGDALLTKMAHRIVDHIRGSDVLARISGDEFLLMIHPLESEDQLAAIINNILDQLRAPYFIEGFEIFASASIGVSVCPEHGTDYETLRRNADSAMYQVKSSSKGGAAIFDRAIGHAVTERMKLEQRLRLAVRDCRFRCAFQPKVDIHTQEVVGVEALIRLLDENGVIQAPSSFIGLAVELGLIDDLTHLVLDQTVEAIDILNDAFGPQASISINVAAKQACDVRFMQSFVETLGATRCAERFMVEVTEDAFVAKSQFQTQVLPMLREIGARVSIDDFGTGYSSLSALADITADELKIDRSFITDIHERPRNQSVLKAIESLGGALGMNIVAEGVETTEELEYLRNFTKIHYAQGYYFAKPLFFEDFSPLKRLAGESRSSSHREPAEKRRVHSRSR